MGASCTAGLYGLLCVVKPHLCLVLAFAGKLCAAADPFCLAERSHCSILTSKTRPCKVPSSSASSSAEHAQVLCLNPLSVDTFSIDQPCEHHKSLLLQYRLVRDFTNRKYVGPRIEDKILLGLIVLSQQDLLCTHHTEPILAI